MCDLCVEDSGFREAWDTYHAALGELWITEFADHGGANEFSLRVPMLHLAFRRGWQASRAALRPEFDEYRRLVRAEIEAKVEAAYHLGKAEGIDDAQHQIAAHIQEEQLRLDLARTGHKGSA